MDDKIFVVVVHGEVDSAYTDPSKASLQVANLCKFELDNVMYDEHGYSQSESGAVKMVEVYLQR